MSSEQSAAYCVVDRVDVPVSAGAGFAGAFVDGALGSTIGVGSVVVADGVKLYGGDYAVKVYLNR